MFTHRQFVEVGGLASYGANFPDLFRRAAWYVDKILKGASPGDLPVQQPTKFDPTWTAGPVFAVQNGRNAEG